MYVCTYLKNFQQWHYDDKSFSLYRLRPSLAEPNSWKIQINGLTEEQCSEMKKKLEHVKYKREYTPDYVSIRWRIETNRKESGQYALHEQCPSIAKLSPHLYNTSTILQFFCTL